MHPAFRLACAAGVLCIAACHRTPDADAGTPAAAAEAAAPAAATPPPAPIVPPAAATAGSTGSAGSESIADHYACDAGTRLSRNEDGSFRAEIPRNAPIRLARIAGSEPPVFTGSSLYLRIESGGDAILSQGDRTNELRCTAARAPG